MPVKRFCNFNADKGRPVARDARPKFVVGVADTTSVESRSLSPLPLVREGRGWQYVDGYLVNEYLGRVNHTPAWVVEIEGKSFERESRKPLWRRLAFGWRSPRVIQRNRRRLAFVWPLVWPPPDADARLRMRSSALGMAKLRGAPTDGTCGVCRQMWEGGPTMLDGRARHLCPACADAIVAAREDCPPSAISTWLWCAVAGLGGILLQLLFHYTWGWTAVPLALVAGWLMGTANGPNFERWPWLSPALTVVLVLLLQVFGWTLIFGARLHVEDSKSLAALFYWTLVALPPTVLLCWVLGAVGVAMAMVEQKLYRP